MIRCSVSRSHPFYKLASNAAIIPRLETPWKMIWTMSRVLRSVAGEAVLTWYDDTVPGLWLHSEEVLEAPGLPVSRGRWTN